MTMKTTMVPLGNGSEAEVRHDLKPGQFMFVGWAEQLKAEGWVIGSSSMDTWSGVELVQAPAEAVAGRATVNGWMVFRAPQVLRADRYRVKRGRGGRRKRRHR